MAQPTLLTIEEARACTIVRTLTAFTHIPAWRAEPAAEFEELVAPALSQSVRLLLDGAHRFTAAGYNVQTLRLVTTPCEGYLALHDAAAAQAQLQRVVDCVARCCRAWKLPDSAGAGERPAGAGFVQPPLLLNIGRCSARVDTDTLAALLLAHSHVSASMDLPLTDDGVVDDGACAAAADMMSKLAQRSEGGLGNFQFCASAAMPTRCPFFPAAHTTQDDTPAGALQFALGLQHVDLCVTVAERCVATPTLAGSTHAARVAAVRDGITEHLDRVLTDAAHVAAQLAAGHGATFVGVDTSVAPSPSAASVERIFQALDVPRFGAPGSLEVAAALTAAVKRVRAVPLVGYCGLMLPPLEDTGLAAAAVDGCYALHDLLLYSAVCGIGYDVVPVPATTPAHLVAGLLRDVAAMAHRLHKPLSARLFLTPGARAGELTTFHMPGVLCNATVFATS